MRETLYVQVIKENKFNNTKKIILTKKKFP